jgi:hypothetical protein
MSAYEIHLFTVAPKLKDPKDPERTGVKIVYCDERQEAVDIAEREKSNYRHIEIYASKNESRPLIVYKNGQVVKS